MNTEYIKVRKDLYDKYGFNVAVTLQCILEKGEFIGDMNKLAEKANVSASVVRHAVLKMLRAGAISQEKIVPSVYKIKIVDLTKMKSYERE